MIVTEIVHWPGKDTPACVVHAAQLKSLGAAMGFAVSSTIIPPSAGFRCSNCENELKKKTAIDLATKEDS